MKLIKWALWLLLFGVVVLIGGAIFLANKIDPNAYKTQISSKVSSQIGRDFAIEGDLSWRFYPWLGITANGISLANRAGFAPNNMIEAEKIEVQLKLMPLLSKQLDVGKISLVSPNVNLSINEKGETNWGDLGGGAADMQALPDSPQAAVGAAIGGLVIQGIDVSNGRIDWNDLSLAQHYQLNNFQLNTGAVSPGEPINFELQTTLVYDGLADDARIVSTGELLLSESYEQISLTDFKSTVGLGGSAGEFKIDGLNFDVASGELKLSETRATFSVDALNADLSVPDLSVSLEDGTISAPAISLDVDDARLEATLDIKDIFGELSASGQLRSNIFDPQGLFKKLGITALSALPETAMRQFKLDTHYKAGVSALELSELNLKLDQSNLRGYLSFNDFSAPAVRFALVIDQLNVDDYLNEDNQAAAESVGPGAALALPFAALKGLDVKGGLTIGALQMQDLRTNEVEIEIDTRADQIKIKPLTAKLYGGKTDNTIQYDISGETPRVNIKSNLTDLDLGAFLQAMKMSERLDGFGNINTTMQTSGLNADEMIANLNGKIGVLLKDGEIRGVSLQKTLLQVAKVYQQYKGETLDLGAELGDKTKYSDLSADIDIKQGILRTNNIDLKAPGLRVAGGGSIDLNTEAINLSLNIIVVDSFEGQGGLSASELKGETIPLKISGTLASPRIRPDLSKLLKRQLERKLGEKYLGDDAKGASAAEQKKLLKDKLKSKLLDKLFGG